MFDPAKLNPVPWIFHGLEYLKARFNEKSTYAGIVFAIGGGANFPPPWSFMAVAVGVAGVVLPTKGRDCDAGNP